MGAMTYVIALPCVDLKDKACIEECPVDCIYEDYYKANVEFFDDLGSPGGAAKMGVIAKDHPIIAALPPQQHEH